MNSLAKIPSPYYNCGTMSELTKEQKEFEVRLENFNRDFQALQQKYLLRVVAQVPFPNGAILNVPVTVLPMPEPKKPEIKAE